MADSIFRVGGPEKFSSGASIVPKGRQIIFYLPKNILLYVNKKRLVLASYPMPSLRAVSSGTETYSFEFHQEHMPRCKIISLHQAYYDQHLLMSNLDILKPLSSQTRFGCAITYKIW